MLTRHITKHARGPSEAGPLMRGANHPGLICFFGGRRKESDGTAEQTALREAFKEIGLDVEHVQILWRLDNYITRTGFVITPVIGVVDPSEVDGVFEVPLSFLL